MDRRWQAGRFRTDLYGRLYRTGGSVYHVPCRNGCRKSRSGAAGGCAGAYSARHFACTACRGAQGSAGCRIYLHSRYSAFGPGGLPLPMALCRRGRFYADELYLPGRGGGELPIRIEASNDDGTSFKEFVVEVVEKMPSEVRFEKLSHYCKRPIGARSSAVRSILRRRWLISPIRSSSGRLMGNRS